jgi:hypothetical protein
MEHLEIWKDIEDYDGYYQVSNLGRVKSLSKKVNFTNWNSNINFKRRTKERILSNKKVKGYNCILLSKNNKQKNFRVCRLVAIHFIDNPLNKNQVNHIDGNKNNDNVCNLEWVTAKENMIHAKNNNLIKFYSGKEHIASKKVICTKTNKIYDNISIASKEFNISESHLSRMLRNIYTNKTTLKLL